MIEFFSAERDFVVRSRDGRRSLACERHMRRADGERFLAVFVGDDEAHPVAADADAADLAHRLITHGAGDADAPEEIGLPHGLGTGGPGRNPVALLSRSHSRGKRDCGQDRHRGGAGSQTMKRVSALADHGFPPNMAFASAGRPLPFGKTPPASFVSLHQERDKPKTKVRRHLRPQANQSGLRLRGCRSLERRKDQFIRSASALEAPPIWRTRDRHLR